jgi:hypothetical protein
LESADDATVDVDVDVGEAGTASNKRRMCPRPKVNFQYKEKRGRFYCMHPDCAEKNQSSAYLNGFQVTCKENGDLKSPC